METVKFHEDAVKGNDCVLHVSMQGSKDKILAKLEEMVSQIKSPYGKPYQGCVSGFKCTAHVITPIWNGEEY